MENNTNNTKKVSTEAALCMLIIGVMAIDLFLGLLDGIFQGIDGGCGSSCKSFFQLIILPTILYICILISLRFIRKIPAILGIWIFASGFIYSSGLAIILPIILFIISIKWATVEYWKIINAEEKTKK